MSHDAALTRNASSSRTIVTWKVIQPKIDEETREKLIAFKNPSATKRLPSIEMATSSFLLLFLSLVLSLFCVNAQSIPAKFDGFVYGSKSSHFNPDTIMIEAFFDPTCPDSRDAWPPLKKAVGYYGPKVSLVLHTFPLPYHDNAYVTSRALHIVDSISHSATYPLLEKFFEEQNKFYNDRTSNWTRMAVTEYVIEFVSESLGNEYSSAVKSGFNDRATDLKTRVAFKYGCSRGVFGTPFFFVNGFPLPDAGSAIDYHGWRKVIDPLIASKKEDIFQSLLLV